MTRRIRTIEYDYDNKSAYQQSAKHIAAAFLKALLSNDKQGIMCVTVKDDASEEGAIHAQMMATIPKSLYKEAILGLGLVQNELLQKLPAKEQIECVRILLNELLRS